jgi:hypothetical protein
VGYKGLESCLSIHCLVELFGDKILEEERKSLIDEANQLRKIFSGMLIKIIAKSEAGKK